MLLADPPHGAVDLIPMRRATSFPDSATIMIYHCGEVISL
jgi:hypothetical protein